jgi:hypothetical protein
MTGLAETAVKNRRQPGRDDAAIHRLLLDTAGITSTDLI